MFSKPAQQWAGKGSGMFAGDHHSSAITTTTARTSTTTAGTAAAPLPGAAPSFGGKGARPPARFGGAGVTQPAATGAGKGGPAWYTPQFGTDAPRDTEQAKAQPGQPLFRSQQLVFGGARKGMPQQPQQLQQPLQQQRAINAKAARQQQAPQQQQLQQQQRQQPTFQKQAQSAKRADGVTSSLTTSRGTAGARLQARLGPRDIAAPAPTAAVTTTRQPAGQRGIHARLGGKDQQEAAAYSGNAEAQAREEYAYGEEEEYGEEYTYGEEEEYGEEGEGAEYDDGYGYGEEEGEGEEGGAWDEEGDYQEYAGDSYAEEEGEHAEEEALQPAQQQQQQQRSQAAMLFKQTTRGKPTAKAAAPKGKSIFDRLGKRDTSVAQPTNKHARTPASNSSSTRGSGVSNGFDKTPPAAHAPAATTSATTAATTAATTPKSSTAAGKASRLFGKPAVAFGKKTTPTPTPAASSSTVSFASQPSQAASSSSSSSPSSSSPSSSTLFSARLKAKMQEENKLAQQQQQQPQQQETASKGFTMVRAKPTQPPASTPPPPPPAAAAAADATATTTRTLPTPTPARTAPSASPLPPSIGRCPLSVGQVPGFASVRLMPKGLVGAGAGGGGGEEGQEGEKEDEASLARNPLVGGETACDRDKQRLDALEVEVEREARQLVQGRRQLQTNGDASVGAIVGTCPTMCPEIERYRRFCSGAKTGNGGVWGFERTNGRFDHRKAIKEYRKEAADNLPEVPRQLRPPNVLHETMWFMAYHLMNRGMINENKTPAYRQQWYDFVEDRLRSIRKDMKTQRVFNSTTLQVVVMSIRFHCMAFYMLGDVWVDNSTNDQRLRDCYDTLAMHYREMRRTSEEILPYEGEMKAYQLLHAIGQPGNVLQKMPHLMQDAHVKRAMAVLSCVPDIGLRSRRSQGSGLLNYPRFFRLVRSLPFIEACIAYASFDGVRQDALFQMAIASNRSRVPLSDFRRLLGFDGFDDATEFAEGHGLEVAQQRVVFKDKRISIPNVLDRIKQRYRWMDALATDPLTATPLSVGELVAGQRLGAGAKAASGAEAAGGAMTATTPAATSTAAAAGVSTKAREVQAKANQAAALFSQRQQQQQRQKQRPDAVPPSTPTAPLPAAQQAAGVQADTAAGEGAGARRMVAHAMLHRKDGRKKAQAEKGTKPSPLVKHEAAAADAVADEGDVSEAAAGKAGAEGAKARALFEREKPVVVEKRQVGQREKQGREEDGGAARGNEVAAMMFKTQKEQQRKGERLRKEKEHEEKQKTKEREKKRQHEEEAERKRKQKEQRELERKRREQARIATERRRRLAYRMVLEEVVQDIIGEECERIMLWENLVASFQRRRLVAAWHTWFKKFTDPYVTGKPLPVDAKNIVEVDPAEIDPDAHLLQQRLRIHHLHHTLQHAHAGLPALATALRRRPIKPRAVALQFTVIDLFRCPWDVTSTFAPEGGNDCAVHPLALDENHNSNSSSGRADADGTEGLDGSAKRPKRSPKTTATGSADCHASVRVQRMSPLDSSDSGLVPADDADTLAASSVIVVSLIGAPDSVWAGPEHGQWLRLAFKLQPLLDVVPASVPVLVLYDSYGVSAAHVTTRLFAHLPFVHVQAVGLSAAELALACQTQGRTAEEAGQIGVERLTAALASALTVAPLPAVVQVQADDLMEACFSTQLNSSSWNDEATCRRTVVDAHSNACRAALQALDTSAFARHASPALVQTIQRANAPLAQWLRSSQLPRPLHTTTRCVFDGHSDLPGLRQEQQHLISAWEAVMRLGGAEAESAGGIGSQLGRWLLAVCERSEKQLLAGDRVAAPWREFASCLLVVMSAMARDKVAYIDQTACEALEAAVAEGSSPSPLSDTEHDQHARAEAVVATRGAQEAVSTAAAPISPGPKGKGWTSVLQSRRWDEDVSAADRTLSMLAGGTRAGSPQQQRQQTQGQLQLQLQRAKRKGSVSSLHGHVREEAGATVAAGSLLPVKRPKMNTADLEASISELTSLVAAEAKAYGAMDTLDRSAVSGEDGGGGGQSGGGDGGAAVRGGRPTPLHQPAPPFVSALSPVRAAPATPHIASAVVPSPRVSQTAAADAGGERAGGDLEAMGDGAAGGSRSNALLQELSMALRWEKQASARLDQTIQEAM